MQGRSREASVRAGLLPAGSVWSLALAAGQVGRYHFLLLRSISLILRLSWLISERAVLTLA